MKSSLWFVVSAPPLSVPILGGIEVKIPLEEIRYGWIDDLTEEVKQGDHLKVKVLEIDKEEKKVTVSAKATQKNPWLRSIGRYTSGNEYVGKSQVFVNTACSSIWRQVLIRWPVT